MIRTFDPLHCSEYSPQVVAAFDAVDFRMEQIPGEIWPFAEWLWNRHPHNVLEIGVRHGGTAALWHGLCTGRVVGIDWEGQDSLGKETANRANEMESLYDRYRFICGDSRDENTIARGVAALAEVGNNSYDFIFIDGDHSYEGVKSDFINYRPLLSTGGCIAFHDIVDTPTTRNAGQGVFRFWSELKAQNYPEHWKEFCVNGEWGGIGALVLP